MLMDSSARIGGELVGFGIIRADGEHFHKWLDKPIKNTVTKYCLNNLLQLNGTNALGSRGDCYALFVSCGNQDSGVTATRTGVFNFCAYGSDASATTTSDLDLHSRISGFTSTKYTGAQFCGSYFDTVTNSIKNRISHKFDAATSATTIREIGWFNKMPSNTYQMSSRVVMDYPVTLNVGDVFYCTYQFNVTFANDRILTNIFPGMSNPDVKVRRNVGAYSSACNTWDPSSVFNYGFPWIRTNGTSAFVGRTVNIFDPNTSAKLPVYGLTNTWMGYYSSTNVGNHTAVPRTSAFTLNDSTGKFTTALSDSTSGVYNLSAVGTIYPYEMDSFRRDYQLILYDLWGSGSNIYGFLFNGEIYQFGKAGENNTFTAGYVKKEASKQWTFIMRQSWSTEQLQPAP